MKAHRREVSLCPVCLATAAWIAAASLSAGGAAAFAIKKLCVQDGAQQFPTQPGIKEDQHDQQQDRN